MDKQCQLKKLFEKLQNVITEVEIQFVPKQTNKSKDEKDIVYEKNSND